MSNDLPQTIGIDISKATLAYPAGIDRQFANNAKGHKAFDRLGSGMGDRADRL